MFKVFEKAILHSNPDKVFIFNRNSESVSNVIYDLNNHLSTKYPIEVLRLSMEMQLIRTKVLREYLKDFLVEEKKNDSFVQEMLPISGNHSIKGLNIEEFEKIIVKKILSCLELSNPIDSSVVLQSFSDNDKSVYTSDWITVDFNYLISFESIKKETPYIYSLLESNNVVELFTGNQKPSTSILLSIQKN